MQTLFIHIGCEKTGTTSIQRSLTSNREKLATLGTIYPALGVHKFAQINLAAAVQTRQNSSDKNTEYYPKKDLDADYEWDQLISICMANPNKDIVISAEHFSSRLFEKGIEFIHQKLQAIREYFEFKIIVYLRRQDLFLESSYSTFIKAGGFLSFDEFFQQHLNAKNRYDFERLLDNWSRAFGAENLLIIDYEKESASNTLLASFYKLLRVPLDSLQFDQQIANPAWNKDMLEFAMICNLPRIQEKLGSRRLSFLNYCNKNYFSKKIQAASVLLSPQQRKTMINRYQDSNRKVEALYFNNQVLFEHTKFKNDDEIPNGSITRVDLIEILIEAIEQSKY